jgi:GxxExxY protein
VKVFEPISEETERVAKEVVDAAFKVHSALGAGLLESVYKACFIHELRRRDIDVQSEVPVPVAYEGLRLATGLRLDLLVERQVIVELKAVEKMNPVFEAQLLTYLRVERCAVGAADQFHCSPNQEWD